LHFFFARRLLWRFVARSARRAADLKKWSEFRYLAGVAKNRTRRIRFGASFLAARGDGGGRFGAEFCKNSAATSLFFLPAFNENTERIAKQCPKRGGVKQISDESVHFSNAAIC